MKKVYWGQVSVPFLIWLASSCASYTDETEEIRHLYKAQNYKSALKEIDGSSIKDQERNRLLFLLEKATILDRMREFKKSQKTFFAADELADKLYTTSISKEALTYIYNESAQDYPGEDYEKVAIHTLLALSFIEQKKPKQALIEARKINSKLVEINNRYEKKKNRYSEDAFARYLAGMIYESQGQIDSAIIDYTKALKLYEGVYSKEFGASVPDQLVRHLYKLLLARGRRAKAAPIAKTYAKQVASVVKNQKKWRSLGEVAVIHEVGVITPKVAKDFFIPISRQVIRISFPTISSRDGYYGPNNVKVGGSRTVSSDEFQDMNNIARETLDDRRTRLILKQGARLITKGVLTEQAHQKFGPLGGIAANVYSAVTETADTRSWSLLPGRFHVTRFFLPVGKHKLSVKTDGRVSSQIDVSVKAGQLVILRDKG